MRKGLILVNAYTRSESELYQSKRLKEELEKMGIQADICRNIAVEDAQGYDFCIYLDKDKYCARRLEQRSVRLFNCAQAVEVCDDKMLTYLALEGFPMPDTISAPLCYYLNEPVREELYAEIERHLFYPVVVKECFGSLGKGVYKINNRPELETVCEKLKGKPHLFQRFVANSEGRDVRVVVVGGKAICAMKRSSDAFLSNIATGGKGEPYELDDKTKQLCERVSKRLALDYCGIDLLFGQDGFLICEVNSNAFFAATERVTGVNVAKAYAEYIVKEIYGGAHDQNPQTT